ncbi:MAG: hypothetical protein HOD63_15870 [Bacteroidetes bacterium]|jgi:hypothetical protein|nr:hypothetical protein [Bacteroidota bacterium]MBT5527660.1 hypothetical protein [Cytophagia bacterium]MBT3802788.1 hypothetical protein [Bacteroidota bacterium]MBT4340068.1 hypothetical protein [Bacteroidota bacterium]MBT4729758.1 hypothetical protein [Bacteroidota bacterium]
MKYYRLIESTNLKEIGIYPQVIDHKKDYDEDKLDSYMLTNKFPSELPCINFDFDGLLLNNRSKYTDLVSSSFLNSLIGLIISSQFLKIVENFKTVDYKLFNACLYFKKMRVQYYWMHYTSELTEYIDFENSVFRLKTSEGRKEVLLKSIDDYFELRNSIKSWSIVKPTKLSLFKQMDYSYDLFRIGLIDSNTYVSERLKDEFAKNNITGVEFEDTDGYMFFT